MGLLISLIVVLAIPFRLGFGIGRVTISSAPAASSRDIQSDLVISSKILRLLPCWPPRTRLVDIGGHQCRRNGTWSRSSRRRCSLGCFCCCRGAAWDEIWQRMVHHTRDLVGCLEPQRCSTRFQWIDRQAAVFEYDPCVIQIHRGSRFVPAYHLTPIRNL